uniref:Uncharacterized protein n=1 Tax=Arundo donax TaxID=35708 RepID=A0A0A9ALK3_ARUDO
METDKLLVIKAPIRAFHLDGLPLLPLERSGPPIRSSKSSGGTSLPALSSTPLSSTLRASCNSPAPPGVSKFTARAPFLLARSRSAHSDVTPRHFFTLTLTRRGQPSASLFIPASDTGHALMHSLRNAAHLAATHEISTSPNVSDPHSASRSRVGQLAAINSRLADVKFTPMRTNSCKLTHFCATAASPRSPILFAFHPSTCSLRRRGDLAASAANPTSVTSSTLARYNTSSPNKAATPRSLTCSFSRWSSASKASQGTAWSTGSQSPEHRIILRVLRLGECVIKQEKHCPL